MKSDLAHLDQWRKAHPVSGYMQPGDTCGVFTLPHRDDWQRRQFGAYYVVISCDGAETGWDHVSVHCRRVRNRKLEHFTPDWYDMEHIRSLFFDDSETVMQLSVPRMDHISIHDHVLHLWRPTSTPIPLPPKNLV